MRDERPPHRLHQSPRTGDNEPGTEFVERTRDIDNVCAAHSAALLGRKYRGAPIPARIEAALEGVEGTLRSHERTHG